MIKNLENAGLEGMLMGYIQKVEYMNGPFRFLEKMIYEREFNHEGNPVLQRCVSNVVMYEDSGGLVRPDKKRSQDKIEGLVSLNGHRADSELNNLKVMLMAAQDKINDQNIENNTLRKRYYEALRTIQEYKKGV